jgi:putative MATE family efflux protein
MYPDNPAYARGEKTMEKKKARRYEMDMCSGSILKKMLLFALPLMCSSILQLLFNAADIVVVGRFAGDNSLAAVGSNSALISLMTNLFVGLSVGANVTAGHYYGAKQEGELSQNVHTAMLLSLISGIVLTLAGLLGARQILIWMQTPQEVLGLASLYLRIYFLGMTAVMVYNFGASLLRAVGDTQRPLYFLMLAGVVNVVLNLIFVIGLKMDVAGVALATVISQCISAALVVRCLLGEEGGIHLILGELHIHQDKLGRILQVGLPAGFQGMVFSLSNVLIQSAVNGFGSVVVAGSSASGNIESFVYFAMNAFYQATLSFTSQNMGAGNFARIRRSLLAGQFCVVITGMVLGGVVVLLGDKLLGIYTPSPAVIEAGLRRLRIIASTYAVCGMMDVMVGVLRGVGHSVLPMVVSLVGACGVRVLWLATIFRIERFHNIDVVYWSYPVSWLVTLAAHVACYLWVCRRLRIRHGIVI